MRSSMRAISNVEPERAVWDRQVGESAPAWEAFALYRDMGSDRSLAHVSRQVGKHKTLMDRWSRRWSWVARVAAFEDEADRIKQQRHFHAIEEMADRHVNIAKIMQQLALQKLTRIVKPDGSVDYEFDPRTIKPGDIPTWLRVAAEMERKALGVDDDGVTVDVKVATITPDAATLAAAVDFLARARATSREDIAGGPGDLRHERSLGTG